MIQVRHTTEQILIEMSSFKVQNCNIISLKSLFEKYWQKSSLQNGMRALKLQNCCYAIHLDSPLVTAYVFSQLPVSFSWLISRNTSWGRAILNCSMVTGTAVVYLIPSHTWGLWHLHNMPIHNTTQCDANRGIIMFPCASPRYKSLMQIENHDSKRHCRDQCDALNHL